MESSPITIRDLSPESQRFVGPPPPKGTRGRPAKSSGSATINDPIVVDDESVVTAGIDFQPNAHTRLWYIKHVESLDPLDDEKPLHDLNQRWLSQIGAQWPASADPRLYRYMHTNRCYDLQHQKYRKELDLINNLRHDTEIAEVKGQQMLYNELKKRVMDRVEFLAQDLIARKVLAYDDKNQIRRVKAFQKIWNRRKEYWEKKRAGKPESSTLPFSEIDTDNSAHMNDDHGDENMPPPPKKNKSKAKKPISLSKMMTVASTSTVLGKRAEISTPLNDSSSSTNVAPRSKKPRIDLSRSPTLQAETRTSIESDDEHNDFSMMVSTPDENLDDHELDPETAEHIRFAEEILRSPTMTVAPSTPQPATIPLPFASSHNASITRDQPITPESPRQPIQITNKATKKAQVVPSADITHVVDTSLLASRSVENVAKAPTSSPLSVRSPRVREISTPKSRAYLRSPIPTPTANNPELFVILQRSNGTFDFKNKLLYKRYLPSLGANEFFALFSQRSGVPLAKLDELTFRIDFGNQPHDIVVLRQHGDEDEWVQLKENVRLLFNCVRKGFPREIDFNIWVQIGRQQLDVNEEMEDDDELGRL